MQADSSGKLTDKKALERLGQSLDLALQPRKESKALKRPRVGGAGKAKDRLYSFLGRVVSVSVGYS